MKHKVWKFFGFWQHEKEEVWLNGMSAKGLHLVSVGFCKYFFTEGEYGEYTYRLELLNGWLNNAENTAYIRFLEDTGIEHVDTFGRWGYFRKKASDGAFELYSDNTSKIKHYTRIIQMIMFVGLANTLQIPSSIHRIIDAHRYNAGDISTAMIAILAIQLLLTGMLVSGIISLYRKIRKLKKNCKLSE